METLEFNIRINANAEKVWQSLWDSENYKKWASVFYPGSQYKTDDFAQGSRIYFISPIGDGMFSVIEKMEINKMVVFRHLGEVKEFVEQAVTDPSKSWENALESYKLRQEVTGTSLIVKVDILEDFRDYMNKTFPLAIQVIKQISETI
ncbi:MAG TPA: hypothetical protein PLU49_07725 [Saprospiraceae bacterium]|nr:hypothetical protein [Saprospirales bacterium]HRQ29949.1 hypothetical protein [Saprospiraceae bacterium]